MRIDPPPSFPCAIGTAPDATSAAAPPLEPPGLRETFHGFNVGPLTTGAVSVLNANSGVALRTSDTNPVSRKPLGEGSVTAGDVAVEQPAAKPERTTGLRQRVLDRERHSAQRTAPGFWRVFIWA
jgi:hypothetical protein